MLAKKKIDTIWSPKLAYFIGIVASDGSLSKSGRHISITSKDLILLQNIKKEFKLTNKIGVKARGGSTIKKYHVLQFGDVHLYKFLELVGLHQNKSKTIGKLTIPNQFFGHFLRGVVDGDGNISVSKHSESKHKQLKLRIVSASPAFITYLQNEIASLYKTKGGWIYIQRAKSVQILNFGKEDSIMLLKELYRDKGNLYLPRKYLLAEEFLNSHPSNATVSS